MRSVRSTIEHLLASTGRLSPIKLGEQRAEEEQGLAEQVERGTRVLVGNLRSNRSTISHWILVIYVVLSLLAVGWLVFLSSTRDDDVLVRAGVIASLVGVIEGLRRMWIQKTLIDALLAIVEGLPPPEGIKAVESFYWNTFRGKR
jgi:hypothetical protein